MRDIDTARRVVVMRGRGGREGGRLTVVGLTVGVCVYAASE